MHYIGNDSNRVNVLSIGGGESGFALSHKPDSTERVICTSLKINQTDLNSTLFYINEIIMVRLTLH